MFRSEGSRRSPEEAIRGALRDFPGSIAAACAPSPEAQTFFGGESENGRGFAVHVTYVGADARLLVVRTKAAPPPVDPDNPPPFVTVDTLRNAFGIYHQGRGRRAFGGPAPKGLSGIELEAWRSGRVAEHLADRQEFRDLPRTPVSVLIDGVAVAGIRIDYPDCSGVELDWNGQTVQCVGEAADIDVIALRTVGEADYPKFAQRPRPAR